MNTTHDEVLPPLLLESAEGDDRAYRVAASQQISPWLPSYFCISFTSILQSSQRWVNFALYHLVCCRRAHTLNHRYILR